jgi:hypothetical protein
MSIFSIWEISVLFGTSVAFCAEEFDIGLGGGQAHGITTWKPGSVFPGWVVGKTFIETRVGEGAEGEGGERAPFFFFPLAVGFAERVGLVEKVVVRDVGFSCEVVDKYDLESGVS